MQARGDPRRPARREPEPRTLVRGPILLFLPCLGVRISRRMGRGPQRKGDQGQGEKHDHDMASRASGGEGEPEPESRQATRALVRASSPRHLLQATQWRESPSDAK